MNCRYFVNIEPREPSGVVLTVDALPRLLVFGDTPEEALRRAREAIGFAVHGRTHGMDQASVEFAVREPAVPKTVTRTTDEHGEWRSVIKLEPHYDGLRSALMRAAAQLAPTYGGERGGTRLPQCPVHPQAEVIQRTTRNGAECVHLLSDRTIILKPQDDVSDVDPEVGWPEDDDQGEVLKRQNDGSATVTTEHVIANLERLERQLDASDPGTAGRGVPLSVFKEPQNKVSAPGQCRECGRSWSMHGTTDVFGICAEER
jgi:hypothetical protein